METINGCKSTVHLISFDIPYPADYGGVIDVFYKIEQLRKANISVILHCFFKDRLPHTKLNELCTEVYYYKRDLWKAHFSLLPYIVASRNSKELLINLCKNDYPIIFEGIHTCYFLNHPLLKNRHKTVRLHNIEHEYYHNLYQSEKKILRKVFFKIESIKLKNMLYKLQAADSFWAITPHEQNYFQNRFPHKPVLLINPFTNFSTVNTMPGKGAYVLYHGNLSVPENIDTAFFILNHIVENAELPIVMAGKNPPDFLLKEALAKNVKIFPNPGDSELAGLINHAHINLVYSNFNCGLKLKLLSCLYNGRFCIANSLIIKDTFLEKCCIEANSADEIVRAINQLKNTAFGSNELEERINTLKEVYNVKEETGKIVNSLFTT